MNSFTAMTTSLCGQSLHKRITTQQYSEWEKQWIFDALKDYRLGQSFCEYFGISNASPLWHFKCNKFSDQWINDNYVDK